MKDVKTKPANTKPKILGKAGNLPKDAKAVVKDRRLEQAESLKPEMKEKSQERPENYATDKVEAGMQRTAHEAQKAAGKAKDYAVRKIKERHAQTADRKTESPRDTSIAPNIASEDNAAPKQPKALIPANAPKTREHVQQHSSKIPSSSAPQERVQSLVRQKQGNAAHIEKPEMSVKTKEQYIKSHRTEMSTSDTVKTKESYIRGKMMAVKKADEQAKTPEADPSVKSGELMPAWSEPNTQPKIATEGRREYVENKLKTKAEYQKQLQREGGAHDVMERHGSVEAENFREQPKNINGLNKETFQRSSFTETNEKTEIKPLVKTKESYMHSLRQSRTEPVKSPYHSAAQPKQNTRTVLHGTRCNQSIKTRQSVAGTIKRIKSGSAYSAGAKRAARRKSAKAAKRAVKTQKQVTKQAAKQAAKTAKELTQRTGGKSYSKGSGQANGQGGAGGRGSGKSPCFRNCRPWRLGRFGGGVDCHTHRSGNRCKSLWHFPIRRSI